MTNNLKSTTLNIKNFGLNLYRIRTEQGKSRQWLADELGYETWCGVGSECKLTISWRHEKSDKKEL